MPTSKAEQIAQQVIALLTTPAIDGVATGQVLRDPLDALDSETFPALCVELGDEGVPARPVTNVKQRAVLLSVSVLAAGAAPLVVADPIATEAANRLLADPTLGGLAVDLTELGTERHRDELGEGTAKVVLNFQVDYRTTDIRKDI